MIITAAFLLTQTFITRALFNLEESIKKQIFLGIFFGLISISGTYLGVYVDNAIANVRDIGAITGGLFGGPLVGAIAGIMGGVHRASLGGFSAHACALATITNGIAAGFLYRFRRGKIFSPFFGLLFATAAESWHMILTLLIARPFDQALTLVRHVSGPMILTNAVGVGLFLLVIQVSMRERELVSAITAETVLKITEKTLPVLSRGLTMETADIAAKIILKHTNLDAVGITDKDKILAFRGIGEDHHKAGGPFKTSSTRRAIRSEEIVFLRNKKDVGCDEKNCPLASGVIVPMKTANGEIFGVLKLYRKYNNAISPLDIEIAKGLATILATQIELNQIEEEKKLRIVSQLKALQAYINPHFLFNALNTISYVIRQDPEKGRYLIQKLSYILRETIYRISDLVALREEMRLVKSYLEIEKERFGDRLDYEFRIDESLLDIKIPSFTLQPIVENSTKHGYSTDVKKIKVDIRAYLKLNILYFVVSDTGKGIPKDQLRDLLQGCDKNSIGIKNVFERLKNLYGENTIFKIKSATGKGTKVIIGIPIEGVKDWLLEQLSLTTKSLQEKR
jgi:two-component system LytT family sensor kinase/two-component system sensor histidine kinase LytS